MILLKGPHRPRDIGFVGVRQAGDWQVKVYGIVRDGRELPAELVQAALRTAAQALPDPARQTGDGDGADRYGVGFCIVHDSGDRCYILLDWWVGENEIHQKMFSARMEEPVTLAPHPSDAIGCVWELAVTDFERRAWLRHVLANPDGPDVDAYLGATFSGKV